MEEHEAFEQLCGGPTRAFQLLHCHSESMPHPSAYDLMMQGKTREQSKEESFRRRAKRQGFTEQEINAFLELQ